MSALTEVYATKYAPAERVPKTIISYQRDLVDSFLAVRLFVDDMNHMIIILNKERQIVYANEPFKNFVKDDNSLGQRLGESLNCIHSREEIGGCGTSESCVTCGAVNAILNSQKYGYDEQECRIISHGNRVYDLNIWTKNVRVYNSDFTIVSIADISNEKRRKVLERLFFHDVLNTAGSLRNFLELMKNATSEEIKEYSKLSLEIAETLIDELKAQRTLGLAEDSKLVVDVTGFNAYSLFNEVLNTYKNHIISEDKELILLNSDNVITIRTDKTLLKRVLGNLTKNALEASVNEGKVMLNVDEINSKIVFSVHNETYIPKNIQLQIFQRSFSTKGSGRGIGTYSVKLLTEKYLHGKVSFTSTEEFGTTFYITLPKEI